jgi:CheY-like chemotaxis protein
MKIKANILIAENEGVIAKDLERILKKFGYAVSAMAFSGEEAVQKAKEKKPDLVLTDVILEREMDGIEAARQIHSRFNIPVIFIASVSDKKTVERAKEAEPYGFIIKPFEEKLLYTTIEMALYRHRMKWSNMEEQGGRGAQQRNNGNNASDAGLKADWTRATFIVRKEHVEKIKDLAYWNRKKVKEIVDEALRSYLENKIISPGIRKEF